MNRFLLGLFAIPILSLSLLAQNLKPYKGGFMIESDFSKAKQLVVNELVSYQCQVLGQYQPANDPNRWIIVYTSDELGKAVHKHGGLRGFALTQRMALTKERGKIYLSSTTPKYWGAAYFQDDYPSVADQYAKLEGKMKKIFTACGVNKTSAFGSEDGLEIEELQEYQYMFGMPYFEDMIELKSYDSFESAKKALKEAINSNPNTKSVYSMGLADKDIHLIGVALNGPTGESKFLPIVDIGTPKHTCFLPYEVLVYKNKVYMLHGRYRIALSFPDLTMGTFSKIMSTPGDIEESISKNLR